MHNITVEVECPECEGRGEIAWQWRHQIIGGSYDYEVSPCAECDGTGKIEMDYDEFQENQELSYQSQIIEDEVA